MAKFNDWRSDSSSILLEPLQPGITRTCPVSYTQILELTSRTAKQWHLLASDAVRGVKETSSMSVAK